MKITVRADQLKTGDRIYDESGTVRAVITVSYTPIDRWIRVGLDGGDYFVCLPDKMISRMDDDTQLALKICSVIAGIKLQCSRAIRTTDWQVELDAAFEL